MSEQIQIQILPQDTQTVMDSSPHFAALLKSVALERMLREERAKNKMQTQAEPETQRPSK